MPSSVRVGSRPPSSCLIFSNSSGVRPCSRIISGVMAVRLIAEVVIGESLLSHLHQLFASGLCGADILVRRLRSSSRELKDRDQINTNTSVKSSGQECPPHTPVYTVGDEVRYRGHRRTY